ncbi:MAG: ABC transporter [Anaerolineae bacterium SM23_ 63]|nr:MAG: ABC transporter [Anaerolineae bacterium SM23_ 63]HEY48139.1 ABC transporter ATP-binding protein [Anaerolineae bacterium]
MGFFSGLDTEAFDRAYRDRDLVRRMLAYFIPYRRRLVLASLGIFIVAAGGAGTPILVSRGVDLMVEGGVSGLTNMLVSGLFALGVIIWGANWAGRRLITRAVGDVMLDLRRDAFIATTGHDLSFFDEFSTGRVVSRITSDTQEFARVVVLVTDLVSQILQAIILLVVLVGINGRLTLWLIAMMPVIFVVAIGFRRIARQVTRRGFRVMANVNAAIKEAVTGIAIAKNFRQEATIYDEFDEINQQSYRINVRRGFVLATVFPALDALSGVGTAILVYAGGLSSAAGLISVGAWFLFISSLNRFWFPILNLSAFWTNIQNGLSAAERVFALIDAESAVSQIDQQSVPALRGEITFESLSFHYQPGETVLSDFDFHIEPGENIALVGHTGAGKTSIARLISRFYEFQEGRLLIDDKDIRTLNLVEYRRRLGIVSQTPFLFSGSVLDNILYASPNASRREVEEMCRQIGEGAWLGTLPDGLETEVGERGANLSMGQRQLVGLMRVLVQCPAIFILDEATASVDPFTEGQIQEALNMILAESTSIVIAHRLSTVRAADRIIVLREGEIIEEGNHKSLMTDGGHYAELYNTYFRHQSLEYVEQVRQVALGD